MKSYCEIENIDNQAILDRFMFYVEEKIDGANFQISTDGFNVKFASRNQEFDESFKFYNFQDVINRYNLKDCVINLFKSIESKLYGLFSVHVFGELFGGSYPNIKSNGTKIQGKIKYSPNNEFLAYDILVTFKEGNSVYLNEKYMKELFEENKIPYLKTLGYGLPDELFNKFNIRINSTIPSYYGLEELPENSNLIEGIVIKPVHPLYYSDGKRLIFKKKNIEFSEKTIKVKKEVEFSDEENIEIGNFNTRITENRFNSTISKNYLDSDNVSFLIGNYASLIFVDIIEEMRRENESTDNLMKNKKCVNKCKSNIINLIRPLVLKIAQEKQNEKMI